LGDKFKPEALAAAACPLVRPKAGLLEYLVEGVTHLDAILMPSLLRALPA
jgi:hypothetical protein